jgi:hypothetical protein
VNILYFDVMKFLEYYLQRSTTTGNVPETATATEVSFTDPDATEVGNSEQLEGENISYDQKMERGPSKKKSSQQELTEEGKDQN